MKKTLLTSLTVAALSLASTSGSAAPRTAEQALDIARQFVASTPKLNGVRNSGISLAPTAAAQMAKGGKVNATTPSYYVCNIEKGGFVVVSGDDRFKEVLGYSTDGTFTSYDELPDGLQYWLSFLSNEMAAALDAGYERSSVATSMANADVQQSVEPLLATKWNQTAPYNNKIGSYMTGCVATGMAQVMKYWSYPEHGIGSHKGAYSPNYSADFANTTYDWKNMLNEYGTGWESPEEIDAVATLMLHCGVSVDMQWSTSSSAAVSVASGYALSHYFGYNKNIYAENRDFISLGQWKALLIDQLQTGHPICYSGMGEVKGQRMGHYFICDGYDATNGKFHFNWGWSGLYDGYYEITSLEPGTGGAGAGAGSYNLDQQILVNVQPQETGYAVAHFDAKSVSMSAIGMAATVMVENIENNCTNNYKGTIGLAVYNADGTLNKYIPCEDFPMSGLSIGSKLTYEYKYNVNLSGIADGTYTVCSATQLEGIDGLSPIRAIYTNPTYFTMEIKSGSSATFNPQSIKVDLAVESIEIASDAANNVYHNTPALFKVKVKNNSAQDFNDEVGINISAGRGSTQNITAPASIAASETKTINVYGRVTLSPKDNVTAKACYGIDGGYTTFGNGVTINIKAEDTAIDEATTVTAPSNILYNVAGQKVNASTKGIVIDNNGTKYIK